MFNRKQTEQKFAKIQKKVIKIKEIMNKAVIETKRSSYQSTGSLPSPTKRKSDESSQAQSIKQVLHNLKKGYIFTKHSVNTSEPHPKFVYISPDQRYLCWKSPDKQDQKKIQICNIESVIHEGAQRYFEASRDVLKFECCIVILSETRKLQLEAFSKIQAQMFKEDLIRVMKHNKGMAFNYKYTKN